ncbi:hypothetical protein GX51_03656 [Blastomyces parvus]|uniref:Uncharacterized protein n=1 Tax=Blastomyces parvus TaxID=2060905 RepID=A0A2B7X5I5_9EURO|nr:hypothetical protein GX51_03656 [Blastomyces parvus]
MSQISTFPGKQFHSSPPHTAAQAPSTVRGSFRWKAHPHEPGVGALRLSEDEAEALIANIPRPLFESALSSVIRGPSMDSALNVSELLIRLATSPTSSTRHGSELFDKHRENSMLSRLSFILSRHPDYRAVANWCLYRLAEAKEPFAVLYIINQQFLAGVPLKKTILMTYLEEFAQRHLLDAMVLYGRILHERYGRTEEALALWMKAMEISNPSRISLGSDSDEDPYSVLGIPQAWEMYAAVKISLGDIEGSRAAVEAGASQLDHPVAYQYLARIVGNEGQLEKYEEFMIKAAMDSNAEACHELGSFYLELHYSGKGRDKSTKPSRDKDPSPKDLVARKYTNYELRQRAMDWFEIASTGGWGPSALILSCLLREEGNAHKGLRYLEIADDDEKSASKAKDIRHIYLHKTFELDVEKEREIFTKQFAQFD